MSPNPGTEVESKTPEGDNSVERHTEMESEEGFSDFLEQVDTPDSSNIVNEDSEEALDREHEHIEDSEEGSTPEGSEEETEDEESDLDIPDSLDLTGSEQTTEEEEPATSADESDELKSVREELNKVSAQLNKERGERKLAESERRQEELRLEDKNFISEESDLHEVLSDPSTFNKLLNVIRKESIAEARELYIREAPQLVNPAIRDLQRQQTKTREFFSQNKDLIPALETVKMVAEDLMNTGLSEDDMLGKLAQETRRRMGVNTDGSTAQTADGKKTNRKSRGTKPAFAKAGGSRKPTHKQLSSADKAFSDMLANEKPGR